MRNVYLIRHGEPVLPGGEKTCISRTDLALSTVGRMQAALLGEWLKGKNVRRVYHSPLRRTSETARIISREAEAREGLEELDMGVWEGCTFREIRERWPERYTLRGKDPAAYPAPGGESFSACIARAGGTMRQLLEETDGDIAVISHAGVNRLLLSTFATWPLEDVFRVKQPYGCVNILSVEKDAIRVDCHALQVTPPLSDGLCAALWDASEVPENVRHHCRAVADKAQQLGEALCRAGHSLNLELLRSAALLHDMARSHPDHALLGAKWLRALGYPEQARLVAAHHQLCLEQQTDLTEEAVLYLADKLIQGTDEVSIEARFSRSRCKCDTAQARAAHEARYVQAKLVQSAFDQAVHTNQPTVGALAPAVRMV